jgi:hypothetical protein
MSDERLPPKQVWLVKPKSDASFYVVYEREALARERVDSSTAGAELAGPYVLVSLPEEP